MGSSREHAAIMIKMSGAGAVVAKSFARIFYRNAINVGLPAIICNTDKIADKDTKRLVKISENLSPINLPKKPDTIAPISGKNIIAYSI